jgi:hypothetical protein
MRVTCRYIFFCKFKHWIYFWRAFFYDVNFILDSELGGWVDIQPTPKKLEVHITSLQGKSLSLIAYQSNILILYFSDFLQLMQSKMWNHFLRFIWIELALNLIYSSALFLATAFKPRNFKLMHAVKPNFLGFKTCRFRRHQNLIS